MSGAAHGRPVFGVLLSVAGLVIWAGHFTTIYAVSALACERGLSGRTLLGLPWVPALVGLGTLLALVLLGLVLRPALADPEMSLTEGGEAEPRFTRWFAASTAALAALGVLFQAMPVLLVPSCGWA